MPYLPHREVMNMLEDEIRNILFPYVGCASIVNTAPEKEAEDFIMRYLGAIPYFQEHAEHYGANKIPEDPWERSVCWALVRDGNENPNTVVMIHHYDVVDVEDFKLLKEFAFSPELLEPKLKEIELHPEAKEDLHSGGYLFGRGVCDMKAGGAIQLALIRHYSGLKDIGGNLLLLCVPDEENLSAGMRHGLSLLRELKNKYSLNYLMMINSEPHQRRLENPDTGIFSIGSVGKLMPFVYVRGFLSHIGKVFEGFNPLGLLGRIVEKTEMSMALSERSDGEASPPPTWLTLRDGKKAYDVSMPMTAFGCLSILTLKRGPEEILQSLTQVCNEAFDEFIADMNRNHSKLRPLAPALPWQTKILSFKELFEIASRNSVFPQAYEKKIRELNSSQLPIIDATFEAVDFIYQYIDDLSPCVVIGFAPPFYPGVTSPGLKEAFLPALQAYVQSAFGQSYVSENYFTGISDLSYSSASIAFEGLRENMPMFGRRYCIPMVDISMPCINIGPWGKDFHKLTERVYKDDLYVRTPAIIDKAIKLILKGGCLCSKT